MVSGGAGALGYGRAMTTVPTFSALGDESFVSLTTFRRSGEAVSVPVWIGRDGDALTVTTPATSGKVKRLRADPRVELRPCSRRGTVDGGVPPVAGVARIIADVDGVERLTDGIRKKYRWQFRVAMMIERLGRAGRRPRVILRITSA